jgi:uncharacterized membrane protein
MKHLWHATRDWTRSTARRGPVALAAFRNLVGAAVVSSWRATRTCTQSTFHRWPEALATLRNLLLTGVAISIPLVATIWVLNIAYSFINGFSAPYLRSLGVTLPGVGFFVTLLLLVLLGFMATNVWGRQLIDAMERQVTRIPGVGTIYTATKQLTESFKSFGDVSNFKRVVYVEYPSEGCRLIGFVTAQYFDSAIEDDMVVVFLPTSPTPMSGFVIIVPAARVIPSAISLEEAMKLVVSCGLVAPKPTVVYSSGTPAGPTLLPEQLIERQGVATGDTSVTIPKKS